MPTFLVRQETVSEELIEVFAADEDAAIDIAAQGGGAMVDQVVTWPTILGCVEKPSDEDV